MTTDPAAAPPFLARPRVPTVVRIFGLIIIILNGFAAVKITANLLVILLTSRAWSWKMFGGYISAFVFARLIWDLIWMRLGYGLRKGQRMAVYGLVTFTIISVLAAGYFFKIGETENATTILIVVGVMNIPALISAFRHWAAFK